MEMHEAAEYKEVLSLQFMIRATALCAAFVSLALVQVAPAQTLPVGSNSVNVDLPVPGVTVEDTTVLAPNRAQVNATVDPNGLETDVYVEYGAGSLLNQKTPKVTIGAGADPATIVSDLLGLEPNTGYSYRVVAESAAGTTSGPVLSFSTPLTGSSSQPVVVNLGSGAPTINATAAKKNARCTIVGTARNDVLKGTSRKDVICGLGGNDKIRGLGGKDVILGGAGKDREVGGPGTDRLYGNAGNDNLNSRDRKRGDYLDGGSGRDRASVDRKDRTRSVERVSRPKKSSKR